MNDRLNPFPADALEINRRGKLSDEQRRGNGGLRAEVVSRRKRTAEARKVGNGYTITSKGRG
jgi:hypothetical protein